MNSLVLKVFVIGNFFTNCYLIFNKITKKGFIIDIASPIEPIEALIKKEKLNILFIALTHAHFDHIGGITDFYNNRTVDLYVHPEDEPLLKDANLNSSLFFGKPFVIACSLLYLKEGIPLRFESQQIEIIHTPGHTPGSVSFKLGKWLFSGDTIFKHSIGRTDIPLGSSEVLFKSIEKIMKLPQDTVVYPGHGCSTTIEEEKNNNPFL